MATLDDLIAGAEFLLERQTFRKIDYFKPYPKQKEFLKATFDHHEVLFQEGNQQGKSTTGAAFISYALTGNYPADYEGRRWDRPVRVWCTGESKEAVVSNIQEKLFGPAGNTELSGTGFVPKNLIVKMQLGHGVGGGYDWVSVKHVSGSESRLYFKSYDQDVGKWQGATIDILWCDEMPPEKHYNEGLARLIATGGLAIITATPIAGPNTFFIIQRFSERTFDANRDRIVIRGRVEDAPHITKDILQRISSNWTDDEKKARIEGIPQMGSGLVFAGIKYDDILAPIRLGVDTIIHDELGPLDTHTWAFLWGIDPGFGHPFGAVLLGWDKDNDIVYVLAEVKVKGAGPPVQASRMKAIAPHAKVAWPHDAQQTDKGSTIQLKEYYKKEGLNMLGQWATFPTGGFGLEEGIMQMMLRMNSGRFKVSVTCLEWRAEFETYHRKDGLIVKQHDDLLSATRVAIMDLRYAAGGVKYGSPTEKRGGSYIAIGVNDNPLTWGQGEQAD